MLTLHVTTYACDVSREVQRFTQVRDITGVSGSRLGGSAARPCHLWVYFGATSDSSLLSKPTTSSV